MAAAAPVRYFDVEWRTPAGEKEKLAYMGIDPASHSQVTTFIFSQPNTDAFTVLQQLADGDAVFISSVIAEKYGLQAGDSITLLTKTGEKPFKVAAVVVDFYNQGLVITGSWVDMGRYFRQKDANAFLIKVALATISTRSGSASMTSMASATSSSSNPTRRSCSASPVSCRMPSACSMCSPSSPCWSASWAS